MKNFKKFNLNACQTPPNKECYLQVIRDAYWVVDKNGFGLIYNDDSLQHSHVEEIARQLAKIQKEEICETKLYPVVYIEFEFFDGGFNYILD